MSFIKGHAIVIQRVGSGFVRIEFNFHGLIIVRKKKKGISASALIVSLESILLQSASPIKLC
jgi:hypothetical protein